jgi:hypothetical protein
LATGGGLSTRELYSNDDEMIFDLRKPVMISGITEIATKSDLLDRSILIYLPRIEKEKRLTEKKFWKRFYELQPGLLGALLDAAVFALHELPNTELATLPRMADFALWATAAEQGFGLEAGAFNKAYEGNQDEAHQVALDASPLAIELRDWFDSQTYWEGSSTDLLRLLDARLDARKENPKTKQDWPRSAGGLTKQLKRLAPDLRAIGIDVLYERIGGKGVVKVAKTTASTASTAQPQAGKEDSDRQQNADDAVDADPARDLADADDADDAEGGFYGDSVTDMEQTTFADDADDAEDFGAFTNGYDDFSGGVPLVITSDTRRRLYDLGYFGPDIDKMTPQSAWQIVNDGIRRAPRQQP